MKRKMALGAAVLALGAGSAALVQKATAGGAVAVRQDAGGLSLMPAVHRDQRQDRHAGDGHRR